MECVVCKNVIFKVVFSYSGPDKYERYVGIDNVDRVWAYCTKCGFYQSSRNYDLAELEKIYSSTKTGYRDVEFRGESVKQAHKRVQGLPAAERENLKRVKWLTGIVKRCDMLDIGSGLGVFPAEMEYNFFNADCVEENKDSIEFIISELGLPCFDKIPNKKYGLVTVVHVLEHIEKPDDFLRGVRSRLKPGGNLFVEVPDVKEFKYLPPDHDEFNSCHVCFYDLPNLCRVLERNGFEVTDLKRMYYEQRKLSRLMVVCKKIEL